MKQFTAQQQSLIRQTAQQLANKMNLLFDNPTICNIVETIDPQAQDANTDLEVCQALQEETLNALSQHIQGAAAKRNEWIRMTHSGELDEPQTARQPDIAENI